ncbi:histamine N-methyltransferase A-like [Salarias fasciatus]|uniref:histamine N-methyltransferase A-like n=1 Tax=Salarias fasciatus TaxID=181472 RepID=UPI0011768D98|nr:histamine N-methyltransferase A-like [Salarias fasciatus]
MASEAQQTCYEGDTVDKFQFYLQQSGEHQAMIKAVHNLLPQEFQRIAKEKKNLDILGVGSGGGEMDAQILSFLQTTFPAMPITVDIVEGSSKLIDSFKGLVAKSPSLQKIPFGWHVMHSEDYAKQEKLKPDRKKFDFIHMIQMIYYVDDLDETIKFYHSLLKENGRLMIIIEIANGGWEILWRTYKKELCVNAIKDYRSAGDVIAALERQGLKYEEHLIPNRFDITGCFDPSNINGQRMLSFMTETHNFSQSFTPEIRAGILDLLRNKSSTLEDGKVLFNSNLSCIVVHA